MAVQLVGCDLVGRAEGYFKDYKRVGFESGTDAHSFANF